MSQLYTVPFEPTPEMMAAAGYVSVKGKELITKEWQAMLMAAPHSSWIRVSDELPETNIPALVWLDGEETIAVAWIAQWSNGKKQWLFSIDVFNGLEGEITHWMPWPGNLREEETKER